VLKEEEEEEEEESMTKDHELCNVKIKQMRQLN
jgi:hypothetical protein